VGTDCYRFEHLANRQVGGVGCHGRDAEGGDTSAQQQGCKGGGDPFGVAAQGVGDGKKYLGGGWQLQSKFPTKMHRALWEHRTAV
jgi:hypothetical protein